VKQRQEASLEDLNDIKDEVHPRESNASLDRSNKELTKLKVNRSKKKLDTARRSRI
jgi:hypothetical protein